MIEEGADEKLQREVEEQLKFAELERMMMQEEQEAGDLQVILQNSQSLGLNFNTSGSWSNFICVLPITP